MAESFVLTETIIRGFAMDSKNKFGNNLTNENHQ